MREQGEDVPEQKVRLLRLGRRFLRVRVKGERVEVVRGLDATHEGGDPRLQRGEQLHKVARGEVVDERLGGDEISLVEEAQVVGAQRRRQVGQQQVRDDLIERERLAHHLLDIGVVDSGDERAEQPDELDVVHELAARVVDVVVFGDQPLALLEPGGVVEEEQRLLLLAERLRHQLAVALDGHARRPAELAEEAEEARRLLLGGQLHKLADGGERHSRARRPVVAQHGGDAAGRRDVVRDDFLLHVLHHPGDGGDEIVLHLREARDERLDGAVDGAQHRARAQLARQRRRRDGQPEHHGLLPFRPHRLLLLLGRRRRAAAASPPATRRARRPRGLLPAARRATLSLGAGGCGRGASVHRRRDLAAALLPLRAQRRGG
mmetsp:Transcript_2517/g.7732  ORF Transcript_2517/g.7732 Transcript_2517/m.7732 type:complete len:377 (-) Transcript_2517:754-1884(-)